MVKVLAAAVLGLLSFVGTAGAAVLPAPLLATVPIASTIGNSVAFDGQILYYTNLGDLNLQRVTPTGTPLPPTPILGLVGDGVEVLSYDATRDMFWAVDEPVGRSIYLIDKLGVAVFQFEILDLPGECDNASPVPPGEPASCEHNVDGLAYDAMDDSIWFSPDASQRIYHFDTDGTLLGFYDVNEIGQAMQPECENYSSGVAVGSHGTGTASTTAIMYDMAGPCKNWFQYLASDTNTPVKQAVYGTYPGDRAEDNECDSVTFSVNAMWVRDESDGHLYAFAVPNCILGGGVAMGTGDGIGQPGRMTGGGGLPILDPVTKVPTGQKAHHGFMLHCDRTVKPNRLQLSWGNNNHFHLTSVDTNLCTDDPLTMPNPPDANFDTMTGTGHGRYNGVANATVKWKFTDAGEPGSLDHGEVTVKDASGNTVLVATGYLLTGPLFGEGNYQSHGTK
jgi:hypothetical protein